jgi:hypothetical protein
MPQKLLSDILLEITRQHENIEVINCISDTDELDSILKQQAIDVLILGLKSKCLPDFCVKLLENFSDLLIIGLYDDGRLASVYINDVSTDDITRIISTLGKRQGR